MTISEAYELFIMDRRVNGATEKTLLFYRDTAKKFVQFCGKEKKVGVASKQINAYIVSLQDRGLAHNSIHTHWRALKTLWRFIESENLIDEMPKLPKIRVENKEVRPLSLPQVCRIIKMFDDQSFLGLRNQTIFILLFDTGIRLSELSSLRLADVDLEQLWLLVRGKGRKDRWVPFSKSTKQQLWCYIKQRSRFSHNSNDALLINRDGTKLRPRGVQAMFKRLAKKADLTGVRLSPHTMRHSFALNWIESGGDPFSLQRILGHTTQTMTSRYVAMAKASIKTQHEKFSPFDRVQSLSDEL